MSANSATGSAAQSVQKWVIDSDVENELRSEAPLTRLMDGSLSHGSVELYLRCPNITSSGLCFLLRCWDPVARSFNSIFSLLRVDLSGCPKLERLQNLCFNQCENLESVVFGEHSNITNLGDCAFQRCISLKSITLPDNLEVIEEDAFRNCYALERVDCNKKLMTIGDCAFQDYPKLEDFQLASSSISFGMGVFCYATDMQNRMSEIAAAAGFSSDNNFACELYRNFYGKWDRCSGTVKHGDGSRIYLVERCKRSERR